MKAIKKFFKFIIWTVVIVVVLAVTAVLTLPLWIGPVATGTANAVVPGIVKTDFRLNEFGLNQYMGTLHVGDMKLANPTNFNKENCLELGKFDVSLKPLSVFTKKIHIEDITLDGLLVAATAGFGNFMQIAENAQGEKPAEETKEVKEEVKEEASSKEAPKVQIDKLTIKNVTVKVGVVAIPIPTITIEGIGADKPEGASISDAFETIMNKVMESASALGGLLGDLGSAALDAGTEALNSAISVGTDAANAALDAVKNVDVSGAANALTEGAGNILSGAGEVGGKAMNAVGNGASAVGSGASAVINGAGEMGGKAMNAVGSGASAAVDAVGKGAGATVDAVKDIGGAAVDSFKGLFNK